MSERTGAVVVAAGIGKRFGTDKVFAPLGGRPVVTYSVEIFERSPLVAEIVLVVAAENLDRAVSLMRESQWHKVRCREGGARRQDSVRNGLEALVDCDWVAIHDGARPFVTADLIERGLQAVRQTGAAIAAVPVKDTVKVVNSGGVIEETPERQRLWLAQTPQVFRYEVILSAHKAAAASLENATDDAALVERQGTAVMVYEGTYDNVKITTPEDLALAEYLLHRRHRSGDEAYPRQRFGGRRRSEP